MLNFQLTPLSKIFPKPCMFLPLLCLGTILAPTCQQAALGPIVWVRRGGLVPPLQPLYDGPYVVLRRGPTPSPSESGHGTRWSLSAALRLARPRTPRLAARVTAADCWARTQAVLPQPSGLFFSDPLISSSSLSSALPRNCCGTVFLPGEEVVARPGLAAPSQPLRTRYRSCQQAPPKRLDL
jgi:hypothetical protein